MSPSTPIQSLIFCKESRLAEDTDDSEGVVSDDDDIKTELKEDLEEEEEDEDDEEDDQDDMEIESR